VNKLWVKLALAFALVTLVGIAAVGLLANYQLSTGFHRYITQNLIDNKLTPALQTYYQQQNSWEGVERIFQNQTGAQGHGKGRGIPKYTLADANGRVVYDETNTHQTLDNVQRKQAAPIELEGKTIGYLLITAGNGGTSRQAQAFLALITRSLVQAGLAAGLLGLLLGLLFTRHLVTPLNHLARAARTLSRGDLNQRVPVAGSDEVAEVMRAFNEMAEALQRSETLRQNMIADIAHELRTPLSVIQGNLQAMLDGVYPMTEEEVALIYDETLLLNRLVGDLRALTQAEAGQLHLNLVPVAPEPLLTTTVEIFQEAARAKAIQLSARIAPDLPAIQADPDRLRQVLANLMSNALRHTPAQGRISLSADMQGTFVQFSISDTGPGLTPEEQAHVFERFWRADASRSRDHGGSGLGLTIARYIIEAHRGQMNVDSVPGQGATFWFTVPVSDA
jgi:two-component system OmpR family sensor kinase/two-component system sensor histidine kinase BaeS